MWQDSDWQFFAEDKDLEYSLSSNFTICSYISLKDSGLP